MKIKVINQRLYLEPPKTAEGTRKYLRVEFSFSEEWDGMTKTAFFRGSKGNICSQLLENDACTVPAEALAAPGRVGVSVSGVLGDTVITTDIKSFTVPATLSGGTPSAPEPTLWQEVLDKFEKVSEVEEKVTELDKKCDTIPTRVSQLENNSGFLTEHQDISGKLDTEKLPEAIDTALAQAKESGVFDGKDGANGKDGAPGEQGPKGEPGETTYIENPYDDTELKSEIATKITAPENPEVGKTFKIKSVNDDGTFIGEWADCTNLDVRINGESIVRDGVAEIPVAGYTSPTQIQRTGLVHVPSGYGISFQYNTPNLIISNPPTNLIDNRNNMWQADYYALTVKRIDYAVKSAMCDGKGATWTAEEQAAARERMGIDEWESILDITLEEESSFSADFEHEYKKLYIYIDQSGVSEKIHSPIYCCPYSAVNADNKKLNSFHSYYAATTNAFFNISAYWESYGSITKRIMNTTNNQNETTGNAQAYIKSWDTSVCNRVGIGKSFKGIYPSLTIFKPGTKIVIKGVRA